MKTKNLLLTLLPIFCLSVQSPALAANKLYQITVKLNSVEGTAKNEFKEGQNLKVNFVMGQEISDFKQPKQIDSKETLEEFYVTVLDGQSIQFNTSNFVNQSKIEPKTISTERSLNKFFDSSEVPEFNFTVI